MAYNRTLPHVNDRPGLIVMTAMFFCTAIVSVVMRFYSRKLKRLGLGPDDWFAVASLIFVLVLNGIFLGGVIQGPITGHSEVANAWPVHSDLETLAQKYKYAFQTIEKLAFGLIKISILFLWKRILSPIRPFQIFCWVMIGVVAAWSISFFFATVFQCGTHWSWNWAPIGFFLTECTDTLNMLTVFTATDLLTDFIIIFMPVPVVWRLNMPTVKKIGVTSLFMLGIFTIGAGVARMYIYLVTSYAKHANPDFIADFTLFILWSEIEVNVAMIVCCLPVCGPVIGRLRDILYRRFWPSKFDRVGSRSSAKNSHKKDEYLTGSSGFSYANIDHEAYDLGGPWNGQAQMTSAVAQGESSGTDVERRFQAPEGEILVHTEIVSGVSSM